MIYVLTGSSGFVAYHFQEAIRKQGDNVITIPHHLLKDIGSIKYTLRNGFDYLVHLASYGNYYNQTDKALIKECNVTYTSNLLKAIKNIPHKGFVFISSSSVYGKSNKLMNENDTCKPQTDYAKAKLECEKLCEGAILRPFTIYGFMDNPKHLIPTVIHAVRAGLEFKLDPSPVHDYIYVKDLVRAILLFKDQKGVINIGTGLQYSNKDIVDAIESLLNKQAICFTKEHMRTYDSNVWCADITKAKLLGFEPYYNIMEGLDETIYEESKN